MSTERDLLIEAKQGDDQAKLELIRICYADIEITAIKYEPYSERADLLQEGQIGVLNAIRSFKFSADVGFKTYAPFHIHRSINKYVSDTSRLVRIPRETYADWKLIRSAEDQLIADKITPTFELISNLTNFNEEYIADVRAAVMRPISIDEKVEQFGDCDLPVNESQLTDSLNTILNEPVNLMLGNYRDRVERKVDLENASETLYRAMEQLTVREFQVVERLYGFGREVMRPGEIAKELGVNATRVSNLHRSATERLAIHLSDALGWFLRNLD